MHLQSRNPETYIPRTAGVAYKNLNVYGFGQATDYQKTVGNITLEVIGMAKRLFGAGKAQKIEILRDFEGVVKPGEMLVVLGPPGRLVSSRSVRTDTDRA